MSSAIPAIDTTQVDAAMTVHDEPNDADDNFDENEDLTDDYYFDEDIDFEHNYGPGKLHPVHLGDVFKESRYKILRKLGAGSFATVWLAKDRR